MIKFFRTIRRKLLAQGKTIQYLKYAVGEIILVVIGILIALSINNKNDEIAKREAEQNFYKNIKQQLLDDKQSFQVQIDYNGRYLKQFQKAIRLIEIEDRVRIDSLSIFTINLLNYSDFDRQGNIYETMVNSGDIQLVQNVDIIERLRRLEETYMYVNRIENIHYDAMISLVPELMKSIRFHSGKVVNDDELYSYEFQNMFVISLRIMDEKDDVYHRALDEIDNLIQQIDKELL